MITRILHVSDLHFGARDDPILEAGLTSLIERVDPELVIASGDLTNRGRRDQHERAAGFLNRLERPVLAIPGNHDIPYTFPARFTSTWAEFEREWQTTEPEFVGAGAHVVGLNSVRPWRHQSGGITDAQLTPWATITTWDTAPKPLAVAWLRQLGFNAVMKADDTCRRVTNAA